MQAVVVRQELRGHPSLFVPFPVRSTVSPGVTTVISTQDTTRTTLDLLLQKCSQPSDDLLDVCASWGEKTSSKLRTHDG